ncbi:MAG: DEAD/DEAH box helicase [Polyangiaceae bacterium]
MSFARVAVPVPLGQAFSYQVPKSMASDVREGSRVLVSFGRRKILGVVVRLEETTDVPEEKLKPLLAVVDPEPVLPRELLSFLVELARYYLAPVGEVMRLALPALERTATERLDQAGLLDGVQVQAVGKLVQVVRALPVAWDAAPKLRSKQAQQILEELRELGDWVSVSDLARQYKSARGATKRLQELGLVEVDKQQRELDPFFADAKRDVAPTLTEAQDAAVQAVLPTLKEHGFAGFLLHGVTGSGKTEVYLRLVQRCLELGRGAIVLVPEIALTPQLVGRFRSRVGDAIAVLHSGLTDLERQAMWKRLRAGELKVAVGARSALFAPVPDLSLIVVDEEHDGSFKQEEGVRYNARDMALLRAHRAGAVCVLGSATHR